MKDLLYLSMLSMAAISIVQMAFYKPFLSIFNITPEAYPMIRNYLFMNSIFAPLFWSGAFLLPSGLRSSGDARFCMFVSVSTLWIIRVGVGYVLSVYFGMGAMGVWISMFVDWIARGSIYYFRMLSGKWGTKNVIYDN